MNDSELPVAVIFDMDGTLFDTEPLYCQAYRQALAERGIDLSPEVYHGSLAGTTNNNIEKYLGQEFGDRFDLAHYRATWPACLKNLIAASGLPFKPGIEALLTELCQQRVPLAVASSSDLAEIHCFLDLVAIQSHFSVIAGGDEVSAGKPNPEIYFLAATRLGIAPSNCIAIEDSNHGVIAASDAGMTVIMTPSPSGVTQDSERRATVTNDVCAATLAQLEMLQVRGACSASN